MLFQRFVKGFLKNVSDFKYTLRILFAKDFIGSLITIAVIAISLTIPSVFYLIVKNTTILTNNITMGRNIVVYINSDVDSLTIAKYKDIFIKDKRFNNVEIILNNEGLIEFTDRLGISSDLFVDDEDKNPLPHVIVIKPNVEYLQDKKLDVVVSDLYSMPNVELVRVDKDWISKITSIIVFLEIINFIVAAILLLSYIMSMITTISNRVLIYKDEIEVMKLVGATDWYVCQPYMYLGMWFGICGAILSIWFTTIMVIIAGFFVEDISKSYSTNIEIYSLSFLEILMIFGISVLISIFVSILSAKHNISKIQLK
ncbi:MAG: permease-like cell division protein FtsX [Ruminobacter sp.]|nr:permease-like cell division protein FtsX [Ruminobacter sp.]